MSGGSFLQNSKNTLEKELLVTVSYSKTTGCGNRLDPDREVWKMNVRKAKAADIDSIVAIYERIHDGEEQGLWKIGWVRGVYPSRKTAEDALARGDLFVMTEDPTGCVVAAAIINQTEVDVYKNAAWRYDARPEEIMVLHTLTVDPLLGGKGYGRAFVAFYEQYAKGNGCTALRMDTNVINARARKLYGALGYTEVGEVPCVFNGIPGVKLVCLEKYIGEICAE